MHEIAIKNTVSKDLKLIHRLLTATVAHQKLNGYDTWDNFDKNLFQKEIDSNSQYKMLPDNEIVCVFSVVYTDKLIWGKRELGDALYLQRILVNPKHKGKRPFAKIKEWSIQGAMNKNLIYIRMDTWGDNTTIIAYYKTFGFQRIENITTSTDFALEKQYRNKFLALMEYKLPI